MDGAISLALSAEGGVFLVVAVPLMPARARECVAYTGKVADSFMDLDPGQDVQVGEDVVPSGRSLRGSFVEG